MGELNLKAPELYNLLLKHADRLPVRKAVIHNRKLQLYREFGYTEKGAKIQASKGKITVEEYHDLAVNMLVFPHEFQSIIKKLNKLIK